MTMHLIDRPHFDRERLDHRGLSAAASVALHAAVILSVVAAARIATDKQIAVDVTSVLPQQIVWFAHSDTGGGRDSGGAQEIAPPRQARAVGANDVSVPAPAPQPSTDSTVQPPEDLASLPAQPMGDATQILVGAIESRGASAGPGDTGAGSSTGSDPGGFGQKPGPGFGEGVRSGGPGVTVPVLIERVPPKYTVEAMQARIQGSVWIECIVQADGTVGDARVKRSLDRRFGLDEEAIAAAKRWRFKPGLLHGKPVPVIVTIELMFSVR